MFGLIFFFYPSCKQNFKFIKSGRPVPLVQSSLLSLVLGLLAEGASGRWAGAIYLWVFFENVVINTQLGVSSREVDCASSFTTTCSGSLSVCVTIQGPAHCWYCTFIILEDFAVVLFELLLVSSIYMARVKWEQVRVVGVGLGFDRPFEASLTPECVKPWEGGQRESMAVAPIIQPQYTAQAPLLL